MYSYYDASTYYKYVKREEMYSGMYELVKKNKYIYISREDEQRQGLFRLTRAHERSKNLEFGKS